MNSQSNYSFRQGHTNAPPDCHAWWIRLACMLAVLLSSVQVASADISASKVYDYVHGYNYERTLDRPFFEFRYPSQQRQGKYDAMREITIYAITSSGQYVKIAEMPRCHDKLTRYNEHLGRFTITGYTDGNDYNLRLVYARFYPSAEVLKNKSVKGIRFEGKWDIDDDKSEVDDWVKKDLVWTSWYRSLDADKADIDKGKFERTAPGKITYTSNGLKSKHTPEKETSEQSRDGFYRVNDQFTPFYTFCDKTFDVAHGYINATDKSKLELTSAFSNRDPIAIKYRTEWKRTIDVAKGQSPGSSDDDNKQVNQSFWSSEITTTIPGLPYVSDITPTYNQWKKNVTLEWKYDAKSSYQSEWANGKWIIYRYKQGESESSAAYVTETDFNKQYCTVDVPEYDETYIYVISYLKDGWSKQIVGDLSKSVSVNASRSMNITLKATGGEDFIKLDWNYGAFSYPSGCQFEIYYKSTEQPDWKNAGQVSHSSDTTTVGTFTVHNIKSACDDYRFQVRLKAIDTEFVSNEVNASISGTNKVTEATASKGMYQGTVKLTWTASQIDEKPTRYVVSRRMLGDDGAWTDIYTVSGTSDMYTYDDVNVSPGLYYEYKVASYITCSKDSTSSDKVVSSTADATSDGFCQATGTISGRVAYGTGTAVEGVRVNLVQSAGDADAKSQFYSLRVDNVGGGVFVPVESTEKVMKAKQPFTAQAWVRLDRNIPAVGKSENARPMLFDLWDNFSVFFTPDGNKYAPTLRLPKTPEGGQLKTSDTVTKLTIDPDKFYFVSLSYDGDTTFVYSQIDEDGNMQSVALNSYRMEPVPGKNILTVATTKSQVGEYNYIGYLDEVRLWQKALAKEEVLATYDHLLSGDEKGLFLYWPLDEGINKQQTAYDYSRSGGVANGNHGQIQPSNSLSAIVPPESAFSVYGRTDAEGNYVIKGVPFTGSGTNYSVVPSMGVHSFTPQKSSRFVSQSSLNHSGVDFEDTSSFKVTGYVYYQDTQYPVADCNFYVDGDICYKDGEPIKSADDGSFTISVPIGDHFIQVKKQGHVFASSGRYPSDPNNVGVRHTFVEPISNLTFTDSTKVVVAGRVVGGAVEAAKPLGLKQSKATIGKARIKLSAGAYRMNVVRKNDGKVENNTEKLEYQRATGNVASEAWVTGGENNDDVKKIYIETDPETGEFAALMPPLEYKVDSVEILSQPGISFETDKIQSIDATNPLVEHADSITADDGTMERFVYNASLMVTHRVEPTFVVKQKNGKDTTDAFGDAAYNYATVENPKGVDIPLYSVDEESGKVTYTMGEPKGYPVFTQQRSYTFALDGYEEYSNCDVKGKTVTTRVPLQNSTVTITNQFAAGQAVSIQGDTDGEFMKKDSLAQNQLQLDSLGHAEYTFMAGLPNIKEPYTRNLNIVYDVNGTQKSWSENGKFEAIVLGELPTGTNFVTQGPDKILMVLRDPPGTNSSSYYESSVTTTETTSYAGSFVTNNEATTLTKLGYHGATFVGIGAGIIIESEAKLTLEVGAEVNVDITDSKETTTSTTTTTRFTTDDSDEFVGPNGDLFIGAATNMTFGDVRSVDIRPTDDGKYGVNMKTITSTGLEYATNFVYTQAEIESINIPNLEKLRNQLLQPEGSVTENLTDSVIYVSKVAEDDDRFASNNNDKDVWKSDAAKDNATDGPSYKMLLPKNHMVDEEGKPRVFQDKVRWYNEQIKLWKNTLAANEKAKIDAKRNSQKYLITNYSFGGGATIENTVETSSMREDQTTEEFEVLAVVGGTSGVEISGTGVDITLKTTTGTRQTFAQTSSTEKTKALGYVLQEDGGDDALSVDVFNAPDGFGPIFITKGGQTSCPYEGAYESKYYEPGTEINAATMQIEVPRISVENNYATDVPSGGTAQFTLVMQNDSETNTDQWFLLRVNDLTNQSSAKLSIDGEAIGKGGREFLVPAEGKLCKLLQLTQTDQSVLDYENVELVLSSRCQSDPNTVNGIIGDTVAISAHFVPACSDIRLSVPKKVVNGDPSKAKLQMNVSGYDRNYRSFRGFRIQYKGARDNDWKLAQEFVNSDAYIATGKEQLIKGASTAYTLDMSNNALFPDQTYLVRAITVCDFGAAGEINNESEEIEVIKDTQQPRLLGNPSPANGVLTADGELAVTFNEDIMASELLKTDNFSVRGKLNGYEVDHDVALALTGGEGAQTEAAIDLSRRSFAFNMWLKPTAGGEILSHGSSSQKLRLSVDGDGQLVAEIGATKLQSQAKLPVGKWSFLSMSYTYDASGNCLLNADYANDADDVRLFSNSPVPVYEGNSSLAVGNGMGGAIHELTLWNTDRSYAEAKATMYTAKKASTPNLAGYWRMDEGTGTELADVARSRNMHLASPSWYMATENKALQLDGASYADIDISACSPLTDDDYAFEMWFRAEKKQTAEGATIFSTTADGARLDINADGQLQLVAGTDAIPVGARSFADNMWHHMALNVLHDGTAAVFVDGENLLQFTPQQPVKMQSDRLTLGALRTAATDGTASYDYSRYFNGQIDEVRLWNARISQKLLLAQRLQRLEGTEPGLVAYYPFETVTYNGYSQAEVNADLADHAAGSALKAELHAAAAVGDEAPGLKAAPREQNVQFHFTASERRIVIELDEEPAAIEGTTLKFTLHSVHDLNGNISSPITWTAYVQQNQLRWGEQELKLTKQVGEALSLDVEIQNSSSQAENWTVTSLPSWLSAEPESGTLKPLSTGRVHLTVPASVALGRYEQTIYLTGDQGISEPLAVQLTVTGEKPDWTVDASKYTYTMSLIGALEIDGRLSDDEADVVAAFDGSGSCIGVASPKYNSRYDRHFVLMTLYGNAETSGQKVSFRAWDASTGKIHPVVNASQEITVKGDAVYGSVPSPVLLKATDAVEQTWQLGSGWQWLSFSVDPADKSVQSVFAPVAASAEMLKSHDAFAVPSGKDSSWRGALRQIDPLQMYMLNLNGEASMSVCGNQIVPALSPVVLEKGWNWMGYTPAFVASPTYALAAADPVTGDMVKSQHGFAVYQGYEWIGSFDVMQPGEGYMYLSQHDGQRSFSYPSAAPAKAPVRRALAKAESAFPVVDRNAYPNNMTVIARLTDGGVPMAGAEVAMFAGDECRGVSEEIDGLYFITVSGEGSGQLMTVKVAEGGRIHELKQNVVYSDNAMLGTLDSPYLLDISETVGIASAETQGVSVMPRRVRTHVTVSAGAHPLAAITVNTMSGHTVYSNLRPSPDSERIDFQHLPQGVYFVSVTTCDGRQVTVKVTK